MKINAIFSLSLAALTAASVAGARAASIQATPPLVTVGSDQNTLQFMAFRDSTEARLLRDAYRILASGDHDYEGHRVRAMHAVEAAARLLGLDISGDLKDRSPQPLSDAKLSEARGLITQVLGSAEVKGQERVVKHLNEAVKQINGALKIR